MLAILHRVLSMTWSLHGKQLARFSLNSRTVSARSLHVKSLMKKSLSSKVADQRLPVVLLVPGLPVVWAAPEPGLLVVLQRLRRLRCKCE